MLVKILRKFLVIKIKKVLACQISQKVDHSLKIQ
jgi:hypothetical protein